MKVIRINFDGQFYDAETRVHLLVSSIRHYMDFRIEFQIIDDRTGADMTVGVMTDILMGKIDELILK